MNRETSANVGSDNRLTDIMLNGIPSGVSCPVCHTPIVRPPSQLAKSRRLFCSQKCYHSLRQGRYIPWRAGQRKARLLVAKYFELQPQHIVHHEDSDNRNNSLFNLRVFANQADHMAYHHGISGVKPIWDGREQNKESLI